MNRYFGWAFASVVSLGIGGLGVASAADMAVKAPVYKAPPPAVVATWTGCYVGLNAGADWGRSNFSWTGITESATAFAVGAATVVPAAANAKLTDTGFIGGGQVGCNYQTGVIVFGGEADFDYTDLSASRTAISLGNTNGGPATIVPGNITESFSSHWLSTIRGRLGVASGNWLFYGTGGAAIANMSFADQLCFPTAGTPTCNSASGSTTRVGWAAGAGVEWKFTGNWSFKAEYLHADLGNFSYTSVGTTAAGVVLLPAATITHNHNLREDIFRVGVNYGFWAGPVVAKY